MVSMYVVVAILSTWCGTAVSSENVTCKVNGVNYRAGEKFGKLDGCNIHWCVGDAVAATAKACKNKPIHRGCEINGQHVNDYDPIPPAGDCKQCVCAYGNTVCTECPP